jgi:hypothetical protein
MGELPTIGELKQLAADVQKNNGKQTDNLDFHQLKLGKDVEELKQDITKDHWKIVRKWLLDR